MEGGLFWLVGGVWLVRRAWGRQPGIAWGIACLSAGLRWGTTGIDGVQAATRLFGPTVAAAPVLAAVGSCLVLGAALAEEAMDDGLRGEGLPERLSSVVVLSGLMILFVVPGWGSAAPTGSSGAVAWFASAAWWAAAGGLSTVCVLGASRWLRRVPVWIPWTAAAAGALLVGAGR